MFAPPLQQLLAIVSPSVDHLTQSPGHDLSKLLSYLCSSCLVVVSASAASGPLPSPCPLQMQPLHSHLYPTSSAAAWWSSEHLRSPAAAQPRLSVPCQTRASCAAPAQPRVVPAHVKTRVINIRQCHVRHVPAALPLLSLLLCLHLAMATQINGGERVEPTTQI